MSTGFLEAPVFTVRLPTPYTTGASRVFHYVSAAVACFTRFDARSEWFPAINRAVPPWAGADVAPAIFFAPAIQMHSRKGTTVALVSVPVGHLLTKIERW